MNDRNIAEVFPPGEFIKEELEERRWTQSDLAEILGVYPSVVNEIIMGKRSITPETAKGLGDAFGTGAQFWMNLDSAYQLSKVKTGDDSVRRRSKLYEKFPVKDILKRQWIEPSENIDVLEKGFLNFFGITSLEEKPFFAHAARKSISNLSAYESVTPAQWAWLCRARQLAYAVSVDRFSDSAFVNALQQLRLLLPNAEEIRKVPRILASAGIRFLVIEHLAGTKIDGVCFWLDDSSPVVALSLRYDRIDWFWHTLMHELNHVENREGKDTPVVDTELVGDQVTVFNEKPENEKRADRFACEFLIPKSELDSFIARMKPLYPKQRIELFARRINVHPGIVVGQLQFRKEISYKHSREILENIRSIVTASALTDGYGNVPIL